MYIPDIQAEWDEHKAAQNLADHAVDFAEAVVALGDPLGVDEPDYGLGDEPRFARIGLAGTRLLFVIYTMRNDIYRVIHARRATKSMAKKYEEENS